MGSAEFGRKNGLGLQPLRDEAPNLSTSAMDTI
jgi:hypothetical protein